MGGQDHRKGKEFTQRTKDEALERSGGFCEGIMPDGQRCGMPLIPGCYTYDHIIPVWMGGGNGLSNCQVLGWCCDKPKTKQDAKDRAKVKRIIKKREGRMRPKKQIRSGGFQGWKDFRGRPVRRK